MNTSFMNRIKLSIVFSFFLLPIAGFSKQEKSSQYFFSILHGNAKLIFNEIASTPISYTSFHISPAHHKSGMGINIGYVKQKNKFHHIGENYNYYNDDIFIYFQPSFYIQGKYFGIVPGLCFIKVIETDDGPEGLVLTSLRIKIGNLQKLYISLNKLPDIFFGMYSINLHYIFRNRISNAMLGVTKSNGSNSTQLSYQVESRLYRNLFVCLRGNFQFKNSLIGNQIGLGICF